MTVLLGTIDSFWGQRRPLCQGPSHPELGYGFSIGIKSRKCWETVVKLQHQKATVGFVRRVGPDTRPTVTVTPLILVFANTVLTFLHSATGKQTKQVQKLHQDACFFNSSV